MKIYQFPCIKLGKTRNFLKKLRDFLNFFIFLFKICEKEKPDLIHTHSYFDFYIAKLTGIIQNFPVVHTLHSYVYSCPKNDRLRDGCLCDELDEWKCQDEVGLLKNIQKMFMRRFFIFLTDAIITLNKIEFNYFSRFSDRVFFISNWINVDLFKPIYENKEDKSIIFIGGLRPVKRLDILLEAFKKIHQMDGRYKLTIVGDLNPIPSGLSHINIDNFKKKIKTLLSDENIKNQVNFTGIIPKNKMPNIYSRNSVFVSTSRTEVNPISFLEAIACELPVIAFVNPLKLDITLSTPETLSQDIIETNKKGVNRDLIEFVRKKYSESHSLENLLKVYKFITKREEN